MATIYPKPNFQGQGRLLSPGVYQLPVNSLMIEAGYSIELQTHDGLKTTAYGPRASNPKQTVRRRIPVLGTYENKVVAVRVSSQ